MSDNLRAYTKALYGFDATVRRAGDAWDGPSPCSDWTALDVLAHNVEMCRMIAAYAAGEPYGALSQPAVGDDPRSTWAQARDLVLERLDHPGALQTEADTAWGVMPVDKFLRVVTVDPVIHTWDLARATGQEPVLDEGLVSAGLKQLTRAGDSIRGAQFAAAVAVPDDAPELDRFIAISGRRP